jgi:hypothetical protein
MVFRADVTQMSRRCFAQILHRKLVNLMEANEITYLIRGAAFRVHTALGPGLLESVYEAYDIPAIVKQAAQLGLLINFNTNRLEDKISIKRIINSFS